MKRMYHYKECGLDNIWLVDGYQVRRTAYGEAIAIEDVEGLYDLIARGLVEKAGALSGKEIRFLRKHLGRSQRALGAVLGSDEQTVSRWERGSTAMPAAADRLLRGYYREIKQGNARLKELVDRLIELDNEIDRPFRLKRGRQSGSEKAWKIAA
jgi:DNA-binding transcriptional regulator YiaG